MRLGRVEIANQVGSLIWRSRSVLVDNVLHSAMIVCSTSRCHLPTICRRLSNSYKPIVSGARSRAPVGHPGGRRGASATDGSGICREPTTGCVDARCRTTRDRRQLRVFFAERPDTGDLPSGRAGLPTRSGRRTAGRWHSGAVQRWDRRRAYPALSSSTAFPDRPGQ